MGEGSLCVRGYLVRARQPEFPWDPSLCVDKLDGFLHCLEGRNLYLRLLSFCLYRANQFGVKSYGLENYSLDLDSYSCLCSILSAAQCE
jgi:hypothetical protein